MPIADKQVSNRYLLYDKLGVGAMGEVFRALDRLTSDHVALKRVTLPSQQLDFGSRAALEDTREIALALAQEFRILASLHHPHIISVLDYSFDPQRKPFFTMELVENGQNMLDAGHNQSLGKQVDLLSQLLQALAYLHRRGILHRDLKPTNVLVTNQQVKVLDFGLSAMVENARGRQGTLAYMAPEVLMQGPIGPAADLHAVGVLAYQMFTGEFPFKAPTPAQFPGSILYHSPDVSGINPPALARVVARLLEKAPEARYATADEVIVALSDAIDRPPPPESVTIRESFLQAAKFIGRKNELSRLYNALNRAIEGGCAAWLIGGESGVGKSRLVDELRTLALVNGVMVVSGQAIESGGGRPYELWRDVLPHLALSTDLTDLEAGVFKAVVPDIERLVRRDVADMPLLDSPAQQQRLALALLDVLKRQTQPVLLILEDLQWTSESLDLLRQIWAVREQLTRLMIVGTFRDDERPNLPDDLPDMPVLRLARLDEQHIAELSTAMIGPAGQTPEVVEFLTSETEGNLFFLVETVRALAEQAGGLGGIGQITLPASVFAGGVQQIVRRWLAKVDARFQALQKQAAVLGRNIDLAVLRAALPGAPVGDWLHAAAAAAVLDWQAGRWRFAHDKLREAVLRDIPDDEHPTWHRQTAEALETVYPHDPAYYVTLLEHWCRTDQLDKEVYYADKSCDLILNTVNDYALVHQRVNRTLHKLAPDDPRQRCLLIWQATAWHWQGQLVEAEAALVHAQILAAAVQDEPTQARAFQMLGALKNTQGKLAAARDFLHLSLDLYQLVGDRSGIRDVLATLGTTAYFQGEYDVAEAYCQQSLALARAQGNRMAMNICLNNLGNSALARGQLTEAQGFYRHSATLAAETGNARLQAAALVNLGTVFNELGQFGLAQEYYEQAYAQNQRTGNQEQITLNLLGLGEALERQNKLTEALAYYEQGVATAEMLGAPYQLNLAYVCLGGLQRRLGMAAAQESLQKGLTIAHEARAARGVLIAILRMVQLMPPGLDPIRAAEAVGLARQHSSFDPGFKDDLEQALARLNDLVDADMLHAALNRGTTLDLDTVVQELLAGLAPSG